MPPVSPHHTHTHTTPTLTRNIAIHGAPISRDDGGRQGGGRRQRPLQRRAEVAEGRVAGVGRGRRQRPPEVGRRVGVIQVRERVDVEVDSTPSVGVGHGLSVSNHL